MLLEKTLHLIGFINWNFIKFCDIFLQEARLRKEEKLRRKRELRQERGDQARRNTLRRRTYSRVRYGVNGVTTRTKRCWKRIVKYWKVKTATGIFMTWYILLFA